MEMLRDMMTFLRVDLADFLLVSACAAGLVSMGMLGVLWLARIQGSTQRSAGRRVLVYLESAARLGAPLPEMIEAAAVTEGGNFGIRMWNLAHQLREGRSLRDALLITIPQMPARQRELIGAVERSGRLAEGLTALLERERKMDSLNSRTIDWIYPLGLMAFLMAVLSGVMTFVWPKFQEIYADFGVSIATDSVLADTKVPNMTGTLFGDGGLMGFVIVTTLMALFGAAAMLVLIVVVFHRWAGSPFPLLLMRAGDAAATFAGRLPFIGRALRDRQLADICYVVGSCVRSAMPLDAALAEAQTLRLDPVLRWRLGRWSDALRSGQVGDRAARSAGMPRLVAGMLATGQASAQPSEAFEFLYRYYNTRFSRALELLRGALVPAAVLTMGTLVAIVVVAMLTPLFTLIRLQTLE